MHARLLRYSTYPAAPYPFCLHPVLAFQAILTWEPDRYTWPLDKKIDAPIDVFQKENGSMSFLGHVCKRREVQKDRLPSGDEQKPSSEFKRLNLAVYDTRT